MYYRPTYTIIAGDDKTILSPTIKDSNNQNVDLTQYTDIIATLSFKNVIFAKFRLNPEPQEIVDGYVILTTGMFNEFEMILGNLFTRHFVNGYYDLNVTLLTTDIVGTKKDSFKYFNYLLVENGINKNID